MPFCSRCGTPHNDNDKFCSGCGQQFNLVAVQPQQPMPVSYSVDLFWGNQYTFPLSGEVLTISKEMDVFNHYRKEFDKLARIQVENLKQEYFYRIYDFDSFVLTFPEIYGKHRQPLIDAAMDVLAKAQIYDISPEQFENDHTEDFCLCGEDVDNVLESFNNTIEANQDRKIRAYNMMPGMVFSGIGGFAAALAMNYAVNSIAEADIRNANVTPAQRAELFGRINFDNLMNRAYLDYWRVFLSLTYTMYQRGMGVWYPTVQSNERAEGLFQNLSIGRIPPEHVPQQMVNLLQLNPYMEGHIDFLLNRFPTPEGNAIYNYFSL